MIRLVPALERRFDARPQAGVSERNRRPGGGTWRGDVRSPAPRRSKLCIACSDFFYKSQSALTPLLLFSKSNPLR